MDGYVIILDKVENNSMIFEKYEKIEKNKDNSSQNISKQTIQDKKNLAKMLLRVML